MGDICNYKISKAIHSIIQDDYPKNFAASVIIIPYVSGEMYMSSVSSCLLFSEIYDSVDIVMNFQMDAILWGLESSGTFKALGVQHGDVLDYISKCIAGAMLPLNKEQHFGYGNRIIEMVTHLCPNPALKLVDAWQSLPTSLNVSGSPYASAIKSVLDVKPKFDLFDNRTPLISNYNFLTLREQINNHKEVLPSQSDLLKMWQQKTTSVAKSDVDCVLHRGNICPNQLLCCPGNNFARAMNLNLVCCNLVQNSCLGINWACNLSAYIRNMERMKFYQHHFDKFQFNSEYLQQSIEYVMQIEQIYEEFNASTIQNQ
eukprot:TRINITY_DN933_c0_g2_i4.p1 TRINITY_DN933_c0_g2~~TRINITY_DN933_c0_g2_i4.p1  ORF type:complete len:315 (-),score=9.33 TRINITY_DN933_c0_g2_i4:261-1205(-)